MTKEQIDTIAYVIAGFVIAYWVTKNWRVFLRDYFAAKAMHALYTSTFEYEFTGAARTPEFAKLMDELAQDAYQMADAMLKAREQNV